MNLSTTSFKQTLCFLILLLLNTSIIKAQLNPADYFKKPEKTDFQISPDGKYLSWIANIENKNCIFVQEIATGTTEKITKEFSVEQYYWANDKRLVYLVDKMADGNLFLYAIDANGKKNKPLTEFPGVNTEVIDVLETNPFEIIVGLNKRDNAVIDPYRLNIETGDMLMIAQNTGKMDNWIADHEGNLRLATETDGVTTTIYVRNDEKSTFKAITTTDPRETIIPLTFTFNNKNIYALSNRGRDKMALVIMDAYTGNESAVVYTNDKYDVNGAYFSDKKKTAVCAIYQSGKLEYNFMDPETENMFRQLNNNLKADEISIEGSNNEENKYIIKTSSDKGLGSYYLMDKTTGSTKKLADNSPWLNTEIMSNMKSVSYKAKDGLTINGYLTLPKGKDSVNLPVVVIPNANVKKRAVWEFNPLVQFLASKGYAVLEINYRGTNGYGKAFYQAGFKQWGQNIQSDINDGVNWLIKSGVANKSRIAIYGESFGGNIAMNMAANNPDLFRCAILNSAIPDMYSYLNSIPPFWKTYKRMMYDMIGNPASDTAILNAASPVQKINNIKIPLIVAHGAKDMNVKKALVDKMVQDLKTNGVDVIYITKFNESHVFKNEQNLQELYKVIEDFLGKNLVEK